MSILSEKTILIIGDETDQIKELEFAFTAQRMTIVRAGCGATTVADLQKNNIDIILLNHLHDNKACDKLLADLRGTRLAKELPIFALVENSSDDIQSALMLGAADYITPFESPSSVIQKMKVIFGEPDNFSGALTFDMPDQGPAIMSRGKRVYVVEDDPLLRNLLTAKLQSSGFHFEFASTGEKAVEKIKAFKPNVIVLDLMLPIKNGFEILQDLKQDRQLKLVPVIVFSNRDSQEDKQKVFALGADRFYVKAMTDLSALIETIEELSA